MKVICFISGSAGEECGDEMLDLYFLLVSLSVKSCISESEKCSLSVPVIANQSNQNSTAIQWTSECFLSIIRLFTTLLCSIRDCVLRLISTDKVSLPTDPPLSGKEGVIDSKNVCVLMFLKSMPFCTDSILSSVFQNHFTIRS